MERRDPTMTAPAVAGATSAPPTTLSALGSRVVVLGTTGSGKSTLAAELARRLNAPHIELDGFNWEANWTPAAPEVFLARVSAVSATDAWVVDGNYRHIRDILWPRVQTFIWLDYPLPVVFWRLLRRTLWRYFSGAVLWNGNRERLWPQFLTRDSLFIWALTSRKRHLREYPLLPTQPESAHATFIHLRSPRATSEWLATLR